MRKQDGKPKTINLKFMTFETSKINVEFYKELFEEFKRTHPDIGINFIADPYSEYESKILTMAAGGTAPDIFIIGSHLIADYTPKNVLLNIKPFLERSQSLNNKDFFPQAINAFKFDGEIVGKGNVYGLPKDWGCENMLFYNKDMFNEAGLKYPDGNWVEDNLFEAAMRLTKKDERGHVTQYGLEPPWLWTWVYQNGGALLSEDFKRCVMDSSQAIEAMRFGVELSTKYHVAPTISEGKDQGQIFEMGRAAMSFGARYTYVNYKERIKSFQWDVAPPIRWKGKKITTVSAVFGYAISSKTKYPQEAWKLVEFIVGPAGQKKAAKIGYNIPTLKTIAYSGDFLDNPEHPVGLNKMFVDEMEHAVIRQNSPYITTNELFGIYTRETELVLMGNKSIEEAVGTIVKQVNIKIAENIKRRE